MIEYMAKHPDKLLTPLIEHIEMLVITLLLSIVIAAIFCMISALVPFIGNVLIHFFSIVYSIPSLALFAVLIPVTGLGRTTAIVVLVVYNQYLLLRNFLAGFANVNSNVLEAAKGTGMTKIQVLTKIQVPLSKGAIFTGIQLAVVSTINVNSNVLEAAKGTGMTKLQVLTKIQVPLSKGAIFTGIQLAVVSTIGIGTIAASINAGGLGSLLFDGLRTLNTVKILWGTVLSAGLAIVVNGVLNVVKKKQEGGCRI